MPKLLLAVLAALSPALLADPQTVSIPNQNWKISFDAPALEKKRQQQEGPNFVFEGNAKEFNISIFVETPAKLGGNSKDCFEHYWALAARNPIINPKTIMPSNTPAYYKVAYDMQVPNGKHPLVQRNANYYFEFHGRWVDVHISVIDPQKYDDAIFETFDKTLQYAAGATGPAGNANAVPGGRPSAGIAVPGAAPAAAVQDVAEEVAARSGTKGAVAEIISFDGPPGDGRRGAKGILLKNDPQTGTNGTTWSFTYVRDGTAYGLQIIHPHGRGQVIVSLNKEGVNISTPESWADLGWGAGQGKLAARMTKDGAIFFPLTDGTEYQVESRVTSAGAVEVVINGRLAATGRATGASPLSLEIPDGKKIPRGGRGKSEFTGPSLPMTWEPGYAGLILGPMDKGQNACRQVKFQASTTPAR